MEEIGSKRPSIEGDEISSSSVFCKDEKVDTPKAKQGASLGASVEETGVEKEVIASTTASSEDHGHSRNQSATSTASLTREDGIETNHGILPRPSSASEAARRSFFADFLLASTRRLQRKPHEESRSRTNTLQKSTPTSEQRHPEKSDESLNGDVGPFEPIIHKEKGTKPSPPLDHAEYTYAKDEDGFLKGLPLNLLILGLCLVVFLISIDRTIITTAIPFITAEFHSTSDIGWYGSSYLLTACAFQPVFGRVYTLYDSKWSYMLSLFLFELGSLVCATAPSSPALIIGRAIAGFGSAGILTGSFVIVALAVPLRLRPIYTAGVGLMFGVGATIGPLIGGVFTDLVTWRWCFWLNLPVGAVTIIVMLLVYKARPNENTKRTFANRLIDLDMIGNAILLGAAVMLFIALEYTTVGEAWGSAKVIGLLCGFGGTTVLFITWLWFKQDSALIPPAILEQRTVAASCCMAFFTYGALLIHTYFLPIWFQAIFGDSAIMSGVKMIPYFVANALFSLLSGIFVSVVGYFAPPAIIGSAIGTVGCGIFYLFHPGMSTGMWIGFEILASMGFGMSIQQGFTAVQTVLSQEDMAIGTAAVVACQSLGGAIFISVGNSVFQSRLRTLVEGDPIPGVDLQTIIAAGAVAFRRMVNAEQLEILLPAYNGALLTVFLVAVPLGGLAFVSCCCLEWKSVKGSKQGGGNVEGDQTG